MTGSIKVRSALLSGGHLFSAIARVLTTPDLRTKILFALGIITIYRIGEFIPAPSVDYDNVQMCLAQGDTSVDLYWFVYMCSGSALRHVSIVALGILPYLT